MTYQNEPDLQQAPQSRIFNLIWMAPLLAVVLVAGVVWYVIANQANVASHIDTPAAAISSGVVTGPGAAATRTSSVPAPSPSPNR